MRNLVELPLRKQISGKQIDHGFGLIESLDGALDFSIIQDLISKGEHKGKVLYVIRNFIDKKIVEQLANNFYSLIEENGSHRNKDGFVAVQQIGSSQFAKNGREYIQETHKTFNDIDRLLENISTGAFERMFLEKFLEEQFLKQGIHFGPSRYKNGFSCFATFRRWMDNGSMSLMLHEDMAQLAFAAKDNFEINKAKHVIAYNLCVEAIGSGGELTVWNLQPDNKFRMSLDIIDTGYPYPLEYTQGIEKIQIKLNAGDIYFMNGCCIHGVQNVIDGSRITAGRFMANVSNNKVVYWT